MLYTNLCCSQSDLQDSETQLKASTDFLCLDLGLTAQYVVQVNLVHTCVAREGAKVGAAEKDCYIAHIFEVCKASKQTLMHIFNWAVTCTCEHH